MEAPGWQLCANGEPSPAENRPSQEHNPDSWLMDGMGGGMSRGACHICFADILGKPGGPSQKGVGHVGQAVSPEFLVLSGDD